MLNSAGLPGRRKTEEMLAAVVQLFMQEVREVHTQFVKKLERCYSDMWDLSSYTWAKVIARLDPKIGKTISGEQVCARNYTQDWGNSRT